MSEFVPDFGAVGAVVVERFDGSSLRAFKGCHRGKRCFILGNGPSLGKTDLAPLADEITFGVNGIFYMTWQCGFAPTYYVVEDNHVFADNLDRVETVDAVAKFYPSKYRPIIKPAADTHFLPTDWSFYWNSTDWYEKPRFSHDVAEVIYAGQTVTFLNVQLAAYMGFTEIYLIGVDFDYTVPPDAQIDGLTITSVDDDPNHFHPDYFGKGKRWHLPKLDNAGKAMVCAREGVEAAGARIFNATIGGKLEVLERADYHHVVDRPVLANPNDPAHFLLTRALDRAALLGLKAVSIDESLSGTDVEAVVSASPLVRASAEDSDVMVTDRVPAHHAADTRRFLVLAGDRAADEIAVSPEWFEEIIVNHVSNGIAAFWTRSVLELSPDGESVLIPALGRDALLAVDSQREYGIDELGSLAESRSTRWTNGRSLSIEQISELARSVARGDHSFGVVDGYVYIQSRWKPIEPPTSTLVRSPMSEGSHAVAIRS